MAKLRLRELRKEAGITQVELAEILGIKQTHVSRLENSENERVTLDLLIEICQLFDYLLAREVTMRDLLPVPVLRNPKRNWAAYWWPNDEARKNTWRPVELD